jgi:methoxymalonate biosynthesis protein
MAFVDDQPAERAEVMYHVPDVRCYSADEIATLAELPEFNPLNVTEDASRRRVMYQAAARRDAARSDFTGPDEDFLRSLELAMHIQRADENQLARVQELTLRTSQMNATGVHYSDTVLRQLVNQEEHEVLVASLTDRFGTHGAIGVVLLEKHSQVWHLKLLATSCRVVSFGAGSVILRWLIDQSHRAGVHLVADFRRTSRNRIMEVTYRLSGFTEDECPCYTGLPAILDIDGLQRLHLVPAPQVNPLTMTLTAPDLSER